MISRFLTKVFGSHRKEHREAQDHPDRLEARLSELRIESLAESRVPLKDAALNFPGTINVKVTLPDEKVSLDLNVRVDAAGEVASEAAALALGTRGLAGEFIASAMAPIGQAGAPAQISNGMEPSTSFTIAGTAALDAAGDARYSFVATGRLTVADATDPAGGWSISFTAWSAGDAQGTMATSQVVGESGLPTLTINGTGTMLNQQDAFNANVLARLAGAELGDTITAPAIASVQIRSCDRAALSGATIEPCQCVEIAGSLILDGSTSERYRFRLTVSPPDRGVTPSAGFLTIQIKGPSDYEGN